MLILLSFLSHGAEVSGGDMPDLAVQAWRPSIEAGHFLWLTEASTDTGPSFRTVLSYAHAPLTFHAAPGGTLPERTELVGGIGQLDLAGGATVGATRFGVHLPLVLASGQDVQGELGLGDLTGDVRVGLLHGARDPLGLAGSVRLTLPTATTRLPVGGSGVALEVELNADRHLGPVLLAANVGHRAQRLTELENVVWGAQGYVRGGVALPTHDGRAGLALEGNAAWSWQDMGNAAAWPVEGLVEGWHQVGDSGLSLHAGLGRGLTRAPTAPGFRGLVSLSWSQPARPAPAVLAEVVAPCPAGTRRGVDACEPIPPPEPVVTTGEVVLSASGPEGPVTSGTWRVGETTAPLGATLELPPGDHEVVVVADGFRVAQVDVHVDLGGEHSVGVALRPSRASVDAGRIDLRDKVLFESARATLLPVSEALLTEVAELLLAHPELARIRIEGHTDTQGSASYNLDLSRRRAESVRAFLVEQGVAPERLDAEGFGEQRPLVEERSGADRARNRRVEFHVAERSDTLDGGR